MPKNPKDPENNPLNLIDLASKPKAWRIKATRIMICHDHKLKVLQIQVGALIGLSVLILGILIKMALT